MAREQKTYVWFDGEDYRLAIDDSVDPGGHTHEYEKQRGHAFYLSNKQLKDLLIQLEDFFYV